MSQNNLLVECAEEAREVPIEGVNLAMLRQIAHEALNSPALRALAEPRQDVAEGA